jgi:hypothetical protein
MSLSQLHDGINVPECLVRIPWLTTRSELFDFIPRIFFKTTAGGWPQLRFTLLGVTAHLAFNFVSHPESFLLGVEFSQPDGDAIEAAYRDTAEMLRKHLGEPNEVNSPEFFHLRWRDDRVSVDHSASVPENPLSLRRHELRVYYHAGKPRAWVSSNERTLTQVKRLFNSMPGVEVVEVWASPAQTVFSLALRSRRSLAWLAHMACWANVNIQLCFDGYKETNEGLKVDDPSSILHRVTVLGPREPEPGGYSTTLQIVGIYLADYLLERGVLDKAETRRLTAAFNNHE